MPTTPRRIARRRPVAAGRAVAVALLLTVVGPLVLGSAMPGPATSTARRAAKFRLTSPAFANGAAIPDGFTCDGAGASPTLRWKGVPRRAVQLALVVDDPDAPSGTFVHWVAWGIDPAAGRIVEQTVPPGMIQGVNGAGGDAYTGPCPPRGGGTHHYRFTLYALSQPPAVAAGATASALRAAIKPDVLATARLVGTYMR